jgi:hypothetical protein
VRIQKTGTSPIQNMMLNRFTKTFCYCTLNLPPATSCSSGHLCVHLFHVWFCSYLNMKVLATGFHSVIFLYAQKLQWNKFFAFCILFFNEFIGMDYLPKSKVSRNLRSVGYFVECDTLWLFSENEEEAAFQNLMQQQNISRFCDLTLEIWCRKRSPLRYSQAIAEVSWSKACVSRNFVNTKADMFLLKPVTAARLLSSELLGKTTYCRSECVLHSGLNHKLCAGGNIIYAFNPNSSLLLSL